MDGALANPNEMILGDVSIPLGRGDRSMAQELLHDSYVVHCTPEVMEASVDLEEHLIKVPPVAGARRPASQAVGISLTELEAPFSDSLTTEGHTAHR